MLTTEAPAAGDNTNMPAVPGPFASILARANQPAEVGEDEPARDIRLGAIVAFFFFVVFLGWAAFAPLDAAVMSPGKLVVSGQRQTVQHRDGVADGIRVEQLSHSTTLVPLSPAGGASAGTGGGSGRLR